MRKTHALIFACLLASGGSAIPQSLPSDIAAPGETAILTVLAQGAQVYECKADGAGVLTWTFREPVATLFVDGKTVGRHYAGPSWELTDGSIVQGKVAGRAAAASALDIPWLRLEVTTRKGSGGLTESTTIQRINTNGGVLAGPCDKAGSFRSVSYSSDYVFLKK